MYRNAHWYVLIIALITYSGFIPTYFLSLDRAIPLHHVHVTAASGWILLLFAQGFLASHGKLGWHRLLGWSSLLVFPILAATSVYIVWYASAKDVAGGGVFPRLYWMDYWLLPAMIAFWVAGIFTRKNTLIHQRCMLLTLIALAPPGFGRAMYFYLIDPLGGSFNDIWHPMMGLLIAALGFMLFKEGARFWPTRVAFGLVIFIYLSGFAIGETGWWVDFLMGLGRNPGMPALGLG